MAPKLPPKKAIREALPVLSGHPTIANLFDFNGNERLDFGDVVILFTSL